MAHLVPGHMEAALDRRVQPLCLAACQQSGGKVGLHKRLATGEGDATAAAFEEGTIPQDGVHQGVQRFIPAANLQRFAGAEAAQPFHIVGLEGRTAELDALAVTQDCRTSLAAELASLDALAPVEQYVRLGRAAFRVLTPATGQRAPLEKHQGANAGAIMG